MSIRIVPQEQLEQQKSDKMSIVGSIPLLFYPSPKILYTNRIKRLKQLATDNPMSDYLLFCAQIAEVQQNLIINNPITKDLTLAVQSGAEKHLPPLTIANYSLANDWLDYLQTIIQSVKGIHQQVDDTIEQIKSLNTKTLSDHANLLLTGQFHLVDSNIATFIWSALSVLYSQLASQLPGKVIAEMGEHRQFCPVCQSTPIASIVHLGSHVGLRYLHCSLCETQWYVTRVKCTQCEDMSAIEYYSLDNELSPIKSECCDSCHSYLKIFYQDRDPHLEIIADDLNSLILDIETEAEGYMKTGLNPFLFPSSQK